ncbi:MAG: SDR family oxidoreductase [Verrucomicrobia bacterium]|nr:SDR family oxidoreductase [Verrucomicrobiota bacterium]
MSTHKKKRFTDRVVLITGASTGIGLAAARAFAQEGAQLVIASRNADRLRQAAEGFSTDVLGVSCDVSKRSEVDALIEQAVARFGRIDILVNNAAVGILGPLDVVQPADAVALFATNFFGVFHCCQAVLPQMKRQGGGQIINIASLAGLRGIPNAIYSASKAAVISLSETLRLETKSHQITVTVLCPGRVRDSDTTFFETAKKYGPVELCKSPALLTADEVTRVLLNAAAKHKRLVVFPFHAWLLYVINRIAPRVADALVYRQMPQSREH